MALGSKRELMTGLKMHFRMQIYGTSTAFPATFSVINNPCLKMPVIHRW